MSSINYKYIIVYSYIMIIFCNSCKKEEDIIMNPYWGEISASINSQKWKNGQIYAISNVQGIGFSIIVDVYDKFDFLREHLIIYKIPKIEGIYPILKSYSQDTTAKTGALYATLQDDGDVLGDVYRLVATEDNYIEVASISGDEVEGAFQVTFAIDDSRAKVFPLAPDTIRFTNGFFHTRLND